VPCGGLALPPNFDPVTGTWDLKGNDTVQSPDFSSSLTAQYDIDANSGRYGFAVSWYHTASYYADADNGLGQVAPSSRANDRQEPLNLLRASINWTSLTEKWSVSLWGENLTDERYWSHASENAIGVRNNVAAPRTYGVTFGVKM
jgi:iron complex outermembrane receptor protein